MAIVRGKPGQGIDLKIPGRWDSPGQFKGKPKAEDKDTKSPSKVEAVKASIEAAKAKKK